MNDQRAAVSSLSHLPSVDEVLRTEAAATVRSLAGEGRVAGMVREAVETVRGEIIAGGEKAAGSRSELLDRIVELLQRNWQTESGKGTRRVINASGVVIHTNLGRAPLSQAAKKAMVEEASGYCTVEYDLERGVRGRRGERSEALLCQITGAEAAIVVNNCAAAAFMVLNVFAAGREVVISRGEMVEIGGDFRVPDVLEQSGATLREVGTTNRTKLSDYGQATSANTAMFLRVHPSNYRITGFTEMPSIGELAQLAGRRGVILYEDAGSGALADLSGFGITGEPVIERSVAAGADIVSFSGDKLLGGPQAGLIVGRRELIETLRKNPLYRALRVSKLIYAALEATLDSHARSAAAQEIPVQKFLSASAESLALRTTEFAAKVAGGAGTKLHIEIISGNSVVGGGAAPDVRPETALLALRPENGSAASLERRLRMGSTPVVSRLQNDLVLIDLRTVMESEEEELVSAITGAAR